MLVAVDYFTKWAEVEALANIRDMDVKKFVWKNIVTRFGVLDSLISDNGLQFDSKAFRAFCSDLSIKNRYSTPVYPKATAKLRQLTRPFWTGWREGLTRRREDGPRNYLMFCGLTAQPPKGPQGRPCSPWRMEQKLWYQPKWTCAVHELQDLTPSRMMV